MENDLFMNIRSLRKIVCDGILLCFVLGLHGKILVMGVCMGGL